jgi:hypothetical protein
MYSVKRSNDKFVIYHKGTKKVIIEVENETEMIDYLQILNNRGEIDFKQYLQNKQNNV